MNDFMCYNHSKVYQNTSLVDRCLNQTFEVVTQKVIATFRRKYFLKLCCCLYIKPSSHSAPLQTILDLKFSHRRQKKILAVSCNYHCSPEEQKMKSKKNYLQFSPNQSYHNADNVMIANFKSLIARFV